MNKLLLRLAGALEYAARRIRSSRAGGRVVNPVSLADLEERGWDGVEPVFVLSTGRCGSMLLTHILEAAGGVRVAHTPRPELVRASRRAFEEIAEKPDFFVEVIKTVREEDIAEAHRFGDVYVETNNRITFFAPALARAFPSAKFVHLVRHPAAFVRSGIRRRWYQGHPYDLGRIEPPDAEASGWRDRDPIEKIGWLWQATNDFVERFRPDVAEERFLFVRAEDLFADPATAAEILRFSGLSVLPEERLASFLQVPVNAQDRRDFPVYEEWAPEQRELLRRTAPLAERYGYSL